MNFRDNIGKYKVRCAICGGFYNPVSLYAEKYLVCKNCKESDDEVIKGKIKVHNYKLKSGCDRY